MLVTQLDVTLQRSVPGNKQDWAFGYQGELYQAVITLGDPSETFSLGWEFEGESIGFNVGGSRNVQKVPIIFHSSPYNVQRGYENYYATFETLSSGINARELFNSFLYCVMIVNIF